MNMEGLSVIVPAYNEEAALEQSVHELLSGLDNSGARYEVIIVDDGSDDGTAAIADGLSARHSVIRVVHHMDNKMIGGAIITGIANSHLENVIFSPVDSPLEAGQIRDFLEKSAGADIICGFRTERRGYTLAMRFLSRLYHVFLTLLFGSKLRDFTWICLYKRKVFENIVPRFNGICFLPEILIKAERKGLIIKEIRCDMRPRMSGKATVSRPTRILKLFFETIRLWLNVNFGRW